MEILFGIVIFVLDVIAIASVLSSHSSVTRKVIWTLVIIFFPLVGMIIYFLFGRENRRHVTVYRS